METKELSIDVQISGLRDEIKALNRRLDELQKGVDLLFGDHELLEDLSGSLQALKEIVVANQAHQDRARDSLKAEIRLTADNVGDMKEAIDTKTVIVTTQNKNLFNKLFKFFKRNEVSKHE